MPWLVRAHYLTLLGSNFDSQVDFCQVYPGRGPLILESGPTLGLYTTLLDSYFEGQVDSKRCAQAGQH